MSLALAEAGHLRPHIRLAQAISEFSASLDEPRRTTFKNLQSQSAPTAASVIKLTEEINLQGSRSHRAWRPYATRLVLMLERAVMFARAGDVLLGGSRNTISSGVWAVLRFSLEDATKFLSFFQQISNLFMRIGTSSELQQDFASLYPNCKEMHEYMCEYLIVVLKLCRKIIAFGKKTFLVQIGSSQTLNAEFKALETELQQWSIRIDHKARALTATSNVNTERIVEASARSFTVFSSHESRRDALEYKTAQLLRRLCPNQIRFERAWRRERKKGTVKWIFQDPTYLKWETLGVTSIRVTSMLWISGNLGSGKTVLVANLVGRLSCLQGQPLIASFFCRYDDAETLDADTILGSLAHQLIEGVDSREAAGIVKRLSADSSAVLEAMRHIGPLLPRHRLVYIVVDGLDECEISEAKAVLRGLRQLGKGVPLRICCSGRSGAMKRVKKMGL